ncbi:MAG: STAS domain-containing protein [Terracidiphilus sp.]
MNNPRPKNPQSDSNPQIVAGIRQLVRGREQAILEKLEPLVNSRSVCLDLSSIERVDAAGLAALVSLYCAASKAGHAFSVINPPRHVARILAIVGLDRILLPQLVSKDPGETMPPGLQPEPQMDTIAA